ncbi:MAG: FHA domain-containing protein [Deltaproteobacteria bacterium]|jgi:type VI secretion system protein ImpI|nr:FHA domain-containing protein [Deltaproteobacteria bacterium]MBW2537815.1 FHA domain-containing protein [Deltaproteobacteria bacterium]
MSVALKVTVLDSQTNEGFEHTFERFPVRLGRNQLNDLHVDRPYISQFHASFEVNEGQIWAKDLGSTNGTVHQGQKLVRDQFLNVTTTPEVQIGPISIRLEVQEVAVTPEAAPLAGASVLDIGTPGGAAVLEERTRPVQPGQEDPFIRQLVPYIEAYRGAWSNVYRLVYEHLTRLPADVRSAYLKRLLIEHPALGAEADFQKVTQYYGVQAHDFGELTPAIASQAALTELCRVLAPETPCPDDTEKLLAFARRLRDGMEVFLKCFISLRDGYQEFETEVLRKENYAEQDNRVGMAKDDGELGIVLFGPDANPDASHHLHEVFVEVMTHQVALMNGVMEGVRQLLDKLSPRDIEREYERRGKKGGLFSNRFEALWKLYETRHGDYSGEDTETFLIIWGPQFAGAYAKTTGEALQTSGEATGTGLGRFASSANQTRR